MSSQSTNLKDINAWQIEATFSPIIWLELLTEEAVCRSLEQIANARFASREERTRDDPAVVAYEPDGQTLDGKGRTRDHQYLAPKYDVAAFKFIARGRRTTAKEYRSKFELAK